MRKAFKSLLTFRIFLSYIPHQSENENKNIESEKKVKVEMKVILMLNRGDDAKSFEKTVSFLKCKFKKANLVYCSVYH